MNHTQRTEANNSYRAQVFEYLSANPHVLSTEIVAALKLGPNSVRLALWNLRRDNLVTRERIPGKAACYWSAHDVDAPVRSTVKSWAPHMHRCPFVAAIHGPAQVSA